MENPFVVARKTHAKGETEKGHPARRRWRACAAQKLSR